MKRKLWESPEVLCQFQVEPDHCAHFAEENTEAQSQKASKGLNWVMTQNLLDSRVHILTHYETVPPMRWVTESQLTSSAVACIRFQHVSFQQVSANICC